jgi:hypothetical protein
VILFVLTLRKYIHDNAILPRRPPRRGWSRPLADSVDRRQIASIETRNQLKGRKSKSPYTPQNVDVAIAHLERVLQGNESDSLFLGAYLQERVLQVLATPGLTAVQQERLQRLFDRVAAV